MNLILTLLEAWRDAVAGLTMPSSPAAAGTLGAAIGEAMGQPHLSHDRIAREARAMAEIEVREALGLRRFDA